MRTLFLNPPSYDDFDDLCRVTGFVVGDERQPVA